MADGRLPSSSPFVSYSRSTTKTIAQSIDAFAVYEEAVQTPLIEANNLSSLYYNAQDFGCTRPHAKVLREDFSSTGAVATIWLTLGADHRSQAVDIDLGALKVARRRLIRGGEMRHPLGEKWTAKLLQHAEFNTEGEGSRWLSDDEGEEVPVQKRASTWSEGAASDRFERKFQAKQAKLRVKHELAKQKEREKVKGERDSQSHFNGDGNHGMSLQEEVTRTGTQDETNFQGDEESPHLLLLHSSVLSLPFTPPALSQRSSQVTVQSPDIVASLNYALSYFHKRTDLIAYLASVRKSLRRGTGVLISDQFAGTMGEAAREGYGQGRELSAEEEEKEQDELWQRFASEEGDKGFLRKGENLETLPSKLSAGIHGVQLWRPDQSRNHEQAHSQDGASASQWPRGRLSLVRKGVVPLHTSDGEGSDSEERTVEFEYWREDTSVDIKTNRFRMSLSFRFPADGSWVRDYFSYDFRFWTMKEVLEALEEVGFQDIRTEVLDRGAVEELERREELASQQEQREQGSDHAVGAGKEDKGYEDEDEEDGFAVLMQTEKEESRPPVTYKVLEEADKVFARRSFGTYIVAKAPP